MKALRSNICLFSISILCLGMMNLKALGQNTGSDKPAKEHWTKRIFTGGNIGLQFGNLTYIDVSPLVGYKITEKLQAGLGATYIYYKYKDSYLEYQTSIYGGRVFGRYFVLDNLFAHTEYEVLNMEVPKTVTGGSYEYVRRNISSVLVGGGYSQDIGTNSSILLMVLWNLTENQYSPYQNPIIRMGINVGF